MATKGKVVESSFRLGAGRYIQEDGAAERIGEELTLLGCKKPYIIHGKRALAAAEGKIERGLSASGIEGVFREYTSFCDPELCEGIVADETFHGCDCVVGVGGGNVCDAAKLCAAMADLPVITIPTSSATCAAYTPLSVCYNGAGQTIGTLHHKREVNCVIVDMEIICHQPLRLALAGIYDSLAKIYEINQRLLGKEPDEIDIGLLSSYEMSRFAADFLLGKREEFCRDLEAQKNTKTLYDVIYICIALTGVISGLARGSNQTAIAHKVYECLRYLYPAEVHDYLHGEMVGMGLVAQLAYNGEGDAEGFAATMRSLSMPTTLGEVGVTAPDALEKLYDRIAASSAMAGTDESEKERLRRVLELIK